MKINLTLECASLEEAVVTLGKLIGGRAAKAAAAPLANPVPEAQAAPEAAPVEEAPKKTRRPRSDKGGARGPYARGKPVEDAPEAPPVARHNLASVRFIEKSSSDDARQATAPDASAAGVTPPPAAEEPASLEDAQDALETVFKAKGLTKAQELLSQFGVMRLRDLPAEKYRPFVNLVKTVL